MAADKHTPGPWMVRECTRCRVWELTGPKGEDILSGHYVGDDIDGDNRGAIVREADARLIAAAPDLLEALSEALTHIEKHQRIDQHNPYTERELFKDLLFKCDAAIAKATGAQS